MSSIIARNNILSRENVSEYETDMTFKQYYDTSERTHTEWQSEVGYGHVNQYKARFYLLDDTVSRYEFVLNGKSDMEMTNTDLDVTIKIQHPYENNSILICDNYASFPDWEYLKSFEIYTDGKSYDYVSLYGKVFINLTDTTATESDVAEGKVFYKSNGDRAYGTATISGQPITDTLWESVNGEEYGTLGLTLDELAEQYDVVRISGKRGSSAQVVYCMYGIPQIRNVVTNNGYLAPTTMTRSTSQGITTHIADTAVIAFGTDNDLVAFQVMSHYRVENADNASSTFAYEHPNVTKLFRIEGIKF